MVLALVCAIANGLIITQQKVNCKTCKKKYFQDSCMENVSLLESLASIICTKTNLARSAWSCKWRFLHKNVPFLENYLQGVQDIAQFFAGHGYHTFTLSFKVSWVHLFLQWRRFTGILFMPSYTIVHDQALIQIMWNTTVSSYIRCKNH